MQFITTSTGFRPLLAFAASLLLLLPGVACAEAGTANDSEPGFVALFSEHMVLQREKEIPVWGHAPPGTQVEIRFDETERTTSADAAGLWQVDFPALPAGGPHSLQLSGPSGVIQRIEDILIGEVWLCSGQSNMAYRMRQMNDGDRESANPPGTIRLLTVERHNTTRPRLEFKALTGWNIATSDSLAEFSAACFLFARELQQEMNVPFGLINSSWGGSAIEAWIGSTGLRELGGFDRQLDLLDRYGSEPGLVVSDFVSDWQGWWQKAGGASPGPWSASYDDRHWNAAPPQLGNWQLWENAGLETFTGMLWYRKSFTLTAAQAAGGAVLDLGGVDELDVTWVNGKPVGTRFGWGDPRQYAIGPGILKAGENLLAVNVYNSWSAGGLNGPAENIRLTLADGSQVPLGEDWRFQVVPAEMGLPPKAPWESITGLAGLFNAMIAPLRDFGLAGVIWYQGESNTGRPPSYEKLLGAMIGDWRKTLGENLPFIIIQLPNFGALPDGPSDSGWAQLRHDQQQAALADPLTGLVVTLDSADRTDLHPPNKRIVGERAAAVARGLLLGGDEVVDGIVPLRASRNGNHVVVHFGEAGMPLRVAGAASPAGFELCGKQNGCRYVDARLDKNRVVLDAVEGAFEVRYAWAEAPLVNLYGAGGLPLGSFRLEITSD